MESFLYPLQEMDPLTFAGVALLAIAINFVGTYEIQKINQHESIKAGLCSLSMCVLNGGIILQYVNNPLYIVADAVGAFAGTFLMTEISRRQSQHAANKKCQ